MSASSNIWQLEVEQRGGDWCVTSLGKTPRMVISKHATKEAADAAVASMNASSDRGASLRDTDQSADEAQG